MTKEVIHVVASIKAGGEQWEAESYWRCPKESVGWQLVRLQISTSLGNLLEDNQWLGIGCKIKVEGRILRMSHPEYGTVAHRISEDIAPSASQWQLTPLADVRFTIKGGISVET